MIAMPEQKCPRTVRKCAGSMSATKRTLERAVTSKVEDHPLHRDQNLHPSAFREALRVTIQALGWRSTGYLPMQDDIASTAFWYQSEPHAPFPTLPDITKIEVI